MEKMTLKKLAKELRLSTSTISRALSDDYQISKETKERVRNYALRRNYTANRFAKYLREGSTKTIGVVICSVDNAFMAQVIDGIYQHCNRIGYQFLIMQSKGSAIDERECVERLVLNGIDGLLISPSFASLDLSYLETLQHKGLPVVLFDRISRQLKTHQVAVDNFNSGYTSARHMVEKGYKRILIIGCKQETEVSIERVEGMLKGMEELGDKDAMCEIVNYDPTDLKELAKALETHLTYSIDMQKGYDAIFSTTDTFTTMVVRSLYKLGLNVPLIGFCNNAMSDMLIGSPVRIVQPANELGQLAVKQLIELIRHPGREEFETIYLPSRLEEGISEVMN